MAAWQDNACGRLCRERNMRAPWYRVWYDRLGERARFNRKHWAHFAIAAAVRAHSAEPLPALFPGQGCAITATGENAVGSGRIAALTAECRRWRDTYERLDAPPVIRPLLWLPSRLRGTSEQTRQ